MTFGKQRAPLVLEATYRVHASNLILDRRNERDTIYATVNSLNMLQETSKEYSISNIFLTKTSPPSSTVCDQAKCGANGVTQVKSKLTTCILSMNGCFCVCKCVCVFWEERGAASVETDAFCELPSVEQE